MHARGDHVIDQRSAAIAQILFILAHFAELEPRHVGPTGHRQGDRLPLLGTAEGAETLVVPEDLYVVGRLGRIGGDRPLAQVKGQRVLDPLAGGEVLEDLVKMTGRRIEVQHELTLVRKLQDVQSLARLGVDRVPALDLFVGIEGRFGLGQRGQRTVADQVHAARQGD
ncbi:MAG: hypothetical protein MK108_12410 [Mariniblastus sp.]|nr:hypothetical protein [Mariniblastus sp.]